MLVDGIQIADGSSITKTVIDPTRRGVTLPGSPQNGDVFELTAVDGSKAPGVYTYVSADSDWIMNSPDASAVPYDLSGLAVGTMASGDTITRIICVRAFDLKSGFEGCVGQAETAPAAESVFNIARQSRQGINANLGTMTFAAGSTVGTFAQNGSGVMNITRGEVLIITAPTPADSTLAGVAFTLAGALA